MVNRGIIGLALVIVLLAGGLWFFTGDRDLRAIKRQSERLMEALHKSPDDGMLALPGRAREIADFFAQKPVITPGEPLPSIQSREEIVSVAATALHAVKSLNVQILDREVTWVRPHQEASMRVAVDVRVEALDERQRAMHAYTLTWIRENGQWVIASAQPSESIRRPAGSGQ